MDEQRFRTGLGSEYSYTKLYNPRWPHTPGELKLEMDVDVESLRVETLLSQPAPPLCDSSPRRLPAVGTWLNEPGTPHAESQPTEREGYFPLQVSVGGFLHVCIHPEHMTTISLQADVGAIDETTTTKAQATARKEFERLSISRQQRDTTLTE